MRYTIFRPTVLLRALQRINDGDRSVGSSFLVSVGLTDSSSSLSGNSALLNSLMRSLRQNQQEAFYFGAEAVSKFQRSQSATSGRGGGGEQSLICRLCNENLASMTNMTCNTPRTHITNSSKISPFNHTNREVLLDSLVLWLQRGYSISNILLVYARALYFYSCSDPIQTRHVCGKSASKSHCTAHPSGFPDVGYFPRLPALSDWRQPLSKRAERVNRLLALFVKLGIIDLSLSVATTEDRAAAAQEDLYQGNSSGRELRGDSTSNKLFTDPLYRDIYTISDVPKGYNTESFTQQDVEKLFLRRKSAFERLECIGDNNWGPHMSHRVLLLFPDRQWLYAASSGFLPNPGTGDESGLVARSYGTNVPCGFVNANAFNLFRDGLEMNISLENVFDILQLNRLFPSKTLRERMGGTYGKVKADVVESIIGELTTFLWGFAPGMYTNDTGNSLSNSDYGGEISAIEVNGQQERCIYILIQHVLNEIYDIMILAFIKEMLVTATPLAREIASKFNRHVFLEPESGFSLERPSNWGEAGRGSEDVRGGGCMGAQRAAQLRSIVRNTELRVATTEDLIACPLPSLAPAIEGLPLHMRRTPCPTDLINPMRFEQVTALQVRLEREGLMRRYECIDGRFRSIAPVVVSGARHITPAGICQFTRRDVFEHLVTHMIAVEEELRVNAREAAYRWGEILKNVSDTHDGVASTSLQKSLPEQLDFTVLPRECPSKTAACMLLDTYPPLTEKQEEVEGLLNSKTGTSLFDVGTLIMNDGTYIIDSKYCVYTSISHAGSSGIPRHTPGTVEEEPYVMCCYSRSSNVPLTMRPPIGGIVTSEGANLHWGKSIADF